MVWWIGLAWASDAESIEALLAKEKVEAAQKKCERLSAFLPEKEPALREACARAMFPKADHADTFTGWVRFRDAWKGTHVAEEARHREAAVRLRTLGEEALEAAYADFVEDYPDTPASLTASTLQARAAVRGIDSAEEALRVARAYPDADGLVPALKPWFDAFLHARVVDGQPGVTLDPPLPFDESPRTSWAARVDAEILDWDDAAVIHLQNYGLTDVQAGLLLPGGGDYPPCSVEDLELGTRVVLGPLQGFAPLRVPCGGERAGFLSLREGRVVGLAVAPGDGIRLAGADGDRWLVHGSGAERAEIPLIGAIGREAIPLGTVIGRQVGPAWLLHPLAGGLPWYVLAGPPPSAQGLPDGATSATLPSGTTATALPDGAIRLVQTGSATFTRTLPAGTVRPLSPLYQELTRLHDDNPVFEREELRPVPAEGLPAGEPADALADDVRTELGEVLAAFGVEVTGAWQAPLRGDAVPEAVFSGTLAGRPVFGMVDPRRRHDAWQVFLLQTATPLGPPRRVDHDGRTLLWFPAPDGTRQVLRMEPEGLAVHRVR